MSPFFRRLKSVRMRRLSLTIGIIALTLALITVGLFSCMHSAKEQQLKKQAATMEPVCNLLKEQVHAPERQRDEADLARLLTKYTDYFDLTFDKIEVSHTITSVNTPTHKLAVQTFRPTEEHINGTVIVSHGYLTHSGLQSRLIKHLVRHDFIVIAFDLPGHGLSTGKPAFIRDFQHYRNAIATVATHACKQTTSPLSFIGHSTGCAAMLTYLQNDPDVHFRNIIFAAPLIRNKAWHLSKLGTKIVAPFRKRIFRINRKLTNDEEFRRFIIYGNPMRRDQVPLQWAESLQEWYQQTQDWDKQEHKLITLQGKSDSVVDWKYNTRFIKKKYPNSEIHFFENGHHELLNEANDIRNAVYSVILKTLTDNQTEAQQP